MHENRETSALPEQVRPVREGQSPKPDMHEAGESDFVVVPVSQPNKAGQPAAEVEEGRTETEENIAQARTSPTQSGSRVSQGLDGVRQVARNWKQERFTTLLHHITTDLLRQSYLHLRKKAAPGVDGVTWRQYEEGLEDRLAELKDRIHRGAYRAQPSRRIYIPKADAPHAPDRHRGAEAVCGSAARTDLCGGPSAMAVPTATRAGRVQRGRTDLGMNAATAR